MSLLKHPQVERLEDHVSDALKQEIGAFLAEDSTREMLAGPITSWLRPVIEDRNAKVRTYAYSEGGRRACEKQADEYHKFGETGPKKSNDYWAKMNAEADDFAHEKGTMIRDERYKYVMRLSGTDEFYDLQKDPKETENVIADPRYEKEILRMKLEMLKWYQETCDTVPREFDSRSLTEESLRPVNQ